MALGIYTGTGNLNNLKELYVGAGGVKPVKEVYVGVNGSPKKVWPAYANNTELDNYADGWIRYYRSATWDTDGDGHWSGTPGSWEEGSTSPEIPEDSYLGRTWEGLIKNCGVYFSTAGTVSFSSIKYIGLQIGVSDTHTSNTGKTYPLYTVYTSVGNSTTGTPENDSGSGSYFSVDGLSARPDTGGSTHASYTYCFLIDLTNCTRTGYFKIGITLTNNPTTDRTDTGTLYLCSALIGDSSSFSDYTFKHWTYSGTPTAWKSIITVT